MLRLPLRVLLRLPLLVVAVAWIPFALFAAVDVDVWYAIPSLVAFIPYAVIATAVVFLVAVVLKARVIAMIALVGLAVLVVPRAGRVAGAEQPTANGDRLVVATSNVHYGTADVAALMRLVRKERIDVLALQEDTPDITIDLEAAGLRRAMPYGIVQPAPGAAGISLYSRYPVTAVPRVRGDRRTVGGLVQLPSGGSIHVRSTHPPPPFTNGTMKRWEATTRAMVRTTRSVPAPAVLAGDFNATLDHHPFGALIDAGFRDAADEAGQAWRPTWTNGRWATLTLDHILVPRSVAVRRVGIHDLAGTDHDVVVAELRTRG